MGFNLKSDGVVPASGQKLAGMAPLGKKTNAVRSGGGEAGSGWHTGGTETAGPERREGGQRDAGPKALEEMSAVHRGE